jgi:hypothetical protein
VDMPEESHSQRQSTPQANVDIVLTEVEDKQKVATDVTSGKDIFVLSPAKKCVGTRADGGGKTPTSGTHKEKSQTPKIVHKEAKKGRVDRELKKASPASENSNPYSMEFVEEGLVEASTIAKEAESAEVGVSTNVKTKQPTSLT